MKKLILGPPNCGKSLYAETLLSANYNKIGYFATLPSTYDFRHKITRHKERRDQQWVLCEATFNTVVDITLFENLVNSCDAVLLDGLHTYYDFSFFDDNCSHIDYEKMLYFCEQLSSILVRTDCNWVIVDIIPTEFSNSKEEIQLDLIESFHHLLMKFCDVDVESKRSYLNEGV